MPVVRRKRCGFGGFLDFFRPVWMRRLRKPGAIGSWDATKASRTIAVLDNQLTSRNTDPWDAMDTESESLVLHSFTFPMVYVLLET